MVLSIGFASSANAQLAVSDSGGPSFRMPIAVPPGIAGMEPKLSLAFTQGGDGPLGSGWSIQGVSIISRCPATPATDGANPADTTARRGVQFLPSDKLCLDGQRLIPTDVNGTPLAGQTDDARGVSGSIREYRTEQDSFTRIRAYGNSNGSDVNGPAYFKVWTKSGQIIEFGNTADSNVEVEGSSVTSYWGVNRIADTVGNTIDFAFEMRSVAWGSTPPGGAVSGKEWNISEVSYTGRAGITPYNRVHFYYADRPSTSDNAQARAESYHQGAKTVSVRYLITIRSFANRTSSEIPVRTYKVSYTISPITRRLLVTGVQDCRGSDESKCLPAATLAYTSGGNDNYVEAPNSSSLMATRLHQKDGAYGVLTGDFDGDGKTDLIRWSNNPAENLLLLSRPVASGSIGSPDAVGFVQVASNILNVNLVKNDGCYFSIVADFNGDGLSDILRWAANGLSPNGSVDCGTGHSSYIYFSKGDGSFRQEVVADGNGAPISLPRLQAVVSRSTGKPRPPVPVVIVDPEEALTPAVTAGATFYVGDFNGDGRLDLVVAQQEARAAGDARQLQSCNGQCTFVYQGMGNGRFNLVPSPSIAMTSVYSNPLGATTAQRFFVDVDGDGLEDIYQAFSGGHFRSLGNGDFVAVATDEAPNCYVSAQIGDVNGDRKIDRICGGTSAADNRVAISRGNGSTYFASQFNLKDAGQELFSDPSMGQPGVGFSAIDINGDGLSDIIRWKDDASKNVLWLSNGDGSFRVSPTFLNLVGVQLKHSANTYDYVIGDFSGRGHVDILRMADDISQNKLYVKQDQTPPDLLASVTSGLGSTSTVTYASLAQSGAPYTTSRVAGQDPIAVPTYPKLLLQSPMYVVSKLTQDAGLNLPPVETHFAYKDLRVDWTGRGSLGFAETRRGAPGPNGEYLTTTSTYLQDFPYIGLPSVVTQRRGDVFDGGALLSTNTNTYCDRTATAGCLGSAKVRQPFLQQMLEQGFDLNGTALPTITTTNVFNSFGDPTNISVQTVGSAGGVSQTFTKVSTNTYYANTAGDTWILGRLQRSTVANTVPDDLLASASGTGPNAANVQGVPSTSYRPPSIINPAVLAMILDVILTE